MSNEQEGKTEMSLTDPELAMLERTVGPICAREAGRRSKVNGENLDDYKTFYHAMFDSIVLSAVEFKMSTGRPNLTEPDAQTEVLVHCLESAGLDGSSNTDEHFGRRFAGPFGITEVEFAQLNKAFGLLCHDAAWKVIKSYRLEEEENVAQELFIAMLRSASQYRRKCFFKKAFEYLGDLGLGTSPIVQCWMLSFGDHKMKKDEEGNFLQFMGSLPNGPGKPSPGDPLVLDEGAARYIKTCIWNQQKATLKGLGKEKNLRKGEISLSETDGWLNLDEIAVEMDTHTAFTKREQLFENVRVALSERDKRAARTYGILTNPKNDKEVFPKTSEFKLKINSVRKRTRQSYKSIKSDLHTIEGVMSEELKRHRRDLAES